MTSFEIIVLVCASGNTHFVTINKDEAYREQQYLDSLRNDSAACGPHDIRYAVATVSDKAP